MNRRTLTAGAAIVLPAALIAFHAGAEPPPPHPHPDADAAIRRAHRAYFAAREEEQRICEEPAHPAFSPEDEAQNDALGAAQERGEEAMRQASQLPASTMEGLRLKGAILAEAMMAAKDFALDAHSAEIQLTASVAADLAQLLPPEGGQA